MTVVDYVKKVVRFLLLTTDTGMSSKTIKNDKFKIMEWIKYDGKNVNVGEKVLCALQHWHTKNYRYYELKKVDEDDVDFRVVDDNSKISYDWNVTHFIRVKAPL